MCSFCLPVNESLSLGYDLLVNMSSAMPFFAINTRRYFGTLLVNSSPYLKHTASTDGTSKATLVSSKHYTRNSSGSLCDNSSNVWECQHKHQSQR